MLTHNGPPAAALAGNHEECGMAPKPKTPPMPAPKAPMKPGKSGGKGKKPC